MVALVAGGQLSISCPHPTSLCSATFPKGEGIGGGKPLVYDAEWLHCRKGGVGDAFRLPRDGKPVPYGALPKMRVILSQRSESKNLRTKDGNRKMIMRRSFGAALPCSG